MGRFSATSVTQWLLLCNMLAEIPLASNQLMYNPNPKMKLLRRAVTDPAVEIDELYRVLDDYKLQTGILVKKLEKQFENSIDAIKRDNIRVQQSYSQEIQLLKEDNGKMQLQFEQELKKLEQENINLQYEFQQEVQRLREENSKLLNEFQLEIQQVVKGNQLQTEKNQHTLTEVQQSSEAQRQESGKMKKQLADMWKELKQEPEVLMKEFQREIAEIMSNLGQLQKDNVQLKQDLLQENSKLRFDMKEMRDKTYEMDQHIQQQPGDHMKLKQVMEMEINVLIQDSNKQLNERISKEAKQLDEKVDDLFNKQVFEVQEFEGKSMEMYNKVSVQVKEIEEKTSALYVEIQNFKTSYTELFSELKQVQGEVNELFNQLKQLKTDVSELVHQFKELQAVYGDDFGKVKVNIVGLQKDVVGIRAKILEDKKKFEEVQGQVAQNAFNQIQVINNQITGLERNVVGIEQKLSSKIKMLKDVLVKHEKVLISESQHVHDMDSQVLTIRQEVTNLVNQVSQIKEFYKKLSLDFRELHDLMIEEDTKVQNQFLTANHQIAALDSDIMAQNHIISIVQHNYTRVAETLFLFLDEYNTVVGFTVYATETRNYKSGQPVVFDGIITNYGNWYDPSNSKFICPRSGYYLFSVTPYVGGAYHIILAINVDGVDMVQAASGNNFDTGHNSIVTYCPQGKKVYIRCVSDGGAMYGDTRRSTFSGVLLFAVTKPYKSVKKRYSHRIRRLV